MPSTESREVLVTTSAESPYQNPESDGYAEGPGDIFKVGSSKMRLHRNEASTLASSRFSSKQTCYSLYKAAVGLMILISLISTVYTALMLLGKLANPFSSGFKRSLGSFSKHLFATRKHNSTHPAERGSLSWAVPSRGDGNKDAKLTTYEPHMKEHGKHTDDSSNGQSHHSINENREVDDRDDRRNRDNNDHSPHGDHGHHLRPDVESREHGTDSDHRDFGRKRHRTHRKPWASFN